MIVANGIPGRYAEVTSASIHPEIAGSWEFPPRPSTRIHLWLAKVSSHLHVVNTFLRLLSPEETARSQAFVFEQDRHRYTLAHGLLRTLLGRYTGRQPKELVFASHPYGKPHLTDNLANDIRFNLSHSKQWLLFAFATAREIGADVEGGRRQRNHEPLAERIFSPREKLEYATIPESQREAAFYHVWVQKEAVIKACGLGLRHPLEQLTVPCQPREAAQWTTVQANKPTPNAWSVYPFEVDPRHWAAVAIEGEPLPADIFLLT